MIRIAVCDHDAAERIRLRSAVERYANEMFVNNIEVTQFSSIDLFEQAAERMREGFYDLCFCRIEGATGEEPADVEAEEPADVEAARRMRNACRDLRMVLVSDDKAHAIYAYNLDAGFLLITGTYDDFKRVVSEPLTSVAQSRAAVASVKSSGSLENVVLADIQFVESSKRGPIIHLPRGKTVPVRGTLQTLFDTLVGGSSGDNAEGADREDGRWGAFPLTKCFVKAGSSFIVNLDNVRSAGEGSLIFADGEAIIVPVRKRKAVLDALSSFRQR